mgnify:FL=1
MWFAKDTRRAAHAAVPQEGPKEGDVKVPIEVEGEQDEAAADATASQADEGATDRSKNESGDAAKDGDQDAASAEKVGTKDAQDTQDASGSDEDERAKVEAAIRAGEQAAERDLKLVAERLCRERDELRGKLDEAAWEIESAKQKAADSLTRLTRLQADWENFRRRTAQERLAEKDRAAEKLVLSLLPVLDDMERACKHAAENSSDDAAVMQFVEGVEAIHDKMYAALNREGVEVIDPVGEAFDPMVHQAVGREENHDVFDETVAQVYQKGYRMGGKVIRSAMVTVSCGGPKRPAPEPDPNSPEDAGGESAPSDAAAGEGVG